MSPKAGASAPAPAPILSQYHAPLNSGAAPFFQPPKSPVGGSSANLNGASINSIIGNGDAFGIKTVDTTGGSFVGQSNMGINAANTTGFLSVDASAFTYNPQGAPLGMLGGGKMGGNAGGANTAGAITQGGYQIIPPQTGNTAVYPPQMGAQMPQLMMQQAPMSVGPAMQGGANPQQSQGFFMQPQQLFMNNNGQPMFFRTGK